MVPTLRRHWGLTFVTLLGVSGASACSKIAENFRETAESRAGAAGEGGADATTAAAGADAGPSSTDDSSYAGNSDGEGECRPGQTRCHGRFGFQRCTPDGIWGASQTCGGYSENGTSSYCAVVDEGGGPWAACVDPACWWWLHSGAELGPGRAGVCVGASEIRPCGASTLSVPEPCEGTCRRVTELDGRVLGFCEAACRDGDRECLAGPLYRECTDGVWSAAARQCEEGDCVPSGAGAQPDIACGAKCEPGTSRCTLDGPAVETCSDAGAWQSAACTLGRCVSGGAQAQCQTDCKPGERACGFDGASDELVCNSQGLWDVPSACAMGALCRMGTSGALGCLTCVGPSLSGGNVWGVADSRCHADALAMCGTDNEYASPVACADGKTCVEVKRGAATLAYCK